MKPTLAHFAQRRRVLLALVAAAIVAALLQLTNTNPAVSQSQHLYAYESPTDPGLDPDSEVWNEVKQGISVPLSAQGGTYPTGGSVQTVQLEAVHHDGKLFVRASWPDSTDDSTTTRVEDFADAVAVEFPANGGSAIPQLCMGQAESAVNIWHWRADSNAGVQDPADVYVNSSVDGYPSTEDLFYTAREAGNPFANPELGAVQNLTSQAFGELATLANQNVDGSGRHDEEGWAVVFVRDFEATALGEANFATGTTTDMAVAVWNGSREERNGQKAVSQFVTLSIGATPAFEEDGGNTTAIVLGAVLLVGVSAIGIGLAAYGYREGRRR